MQRMSRLPRMSWMVVMMMMMMMSREKRTTLPILELT